MHSLSPVILLGLNDTLLQFSAVADERWSHACATFAPRLQNVDPAVLTAGTAHTNDDYTRGSAVQHGGTRIVFDGQ